MANREWRDLQEENLESKTKSCQPRKTLYRSEKNILRIELGQFTEEELKEDEN